MFFNSANTGFGYLSDSGSVTDVDNNTRKLLILTSHEDFLVTDDCNGSDRIQSVTSCESILAVSRKRLECSSCSQKHRVDRFELYGVTNSDSLYVLRKYIIKQS